MSTDTIYHALVLNLHQPAGNLQSQLTDETPEILRTLDRIPRALWGYEDVARVHLSLSGTLLETLRDPEFQRCVYGIVDCGSLLWHYQNLALFRIVGTGYYHPVLPLIPAADRIEHLARWRGIGSHVFWRQEFQGFWPPEMGFTMELIPTLRRMGYRYVLVDSAHVAPITPMSWQELRYRPHLARYEGEEIVVIVRDRELSNAQQSGMDLAWFSNEVAARSRWCDFPPLVVTATDGDNGGWFRNPAYTANFWGCYRELLESARAPSGRIHPTFIDDYLDRYGAHGYVHVATGAWNTGWHHGHGFVQWTGSPAQRDALKRVSEASRLVHDAHAHVADQGARNPQLAFWLEEAMWHLLRAETSCNLFWGEAWVPNAHRDLDACLGNLKHAKRLMA